MLVEGVKNEELKGGKVIYLGRGGGIRHSMTSHHHAFFKRGKQAATNAVSLDLFVSTARRDSTPRTSLGLYSTLRLPEYPNV
jgi:hypothetical protein